jgi:spermidine/putrescine transport system substrate-binding protein
VLRYVADVGPPLAAGEASLSLAWSGDVLGVVGKNPDVRFVVPREGTILYVDYACVPRSAPSPDLAFAFLNHLLDPQMAAEFTNTTMFATPNLGALKLLHPEARWLWATLDAVKDQGRFEMLRDVGAASAIYESAWREVREKTPGPAPAAK